MPPKKGVPDDAFKEVELDVNDPRTLILALTAPEPSVAGKAAISLEQFADLSETNKVKLAELGVLKPATDLLSHEDNSVQAQAACLLYTLAGSKAVRLAIREAGNLCVAPMVELLKPAAGPICQENASGFFAYLTSEYTGRAAVMKAGGLDALIQLLIGIVPDAADTKAAPPPPDLARNVVRALGVLFDDYDARAAVGDAGGLESLMVLLDSEYPELQSLALAALRTAAQNKRNQMIVRVCGGLEKLLGMVAKPEYAACHAQVLRVLGELLVDPANMAVVSERGVPDKQNPHGTPAPIEAVQEFVKAGDNETRAGALWCVARAASNEDNRRLLMDLKIEAAVALRIWSDDAKQPLNPGVALAAIAACTALAESISLSEKLASHGVIQKLMRLLTWQDSAECAVAASTALATITADGRGGNCVKLAEADPGLSKVLGLMQSDNPVQLTSGARIIRNLAVTPLTQGDLDDLDLVPGFIKCLVSNDDASQAAAAAALAILGQKAAFRARLLADGRFVQAAIDLTGSHAQDVRQGIFRTIRSVSEDRKLASELCALGALGKLAASTNTFAAVAYKQLLNQHLPAKYGYYGLLELGDTIASPFFDTGALPLQASFLGLDELRAAPVDARREVLLVDTETDGADADLVEFLSSVEPGEGRGADPAELAQAVANRMGGTVTLPGLTTFSSTLTVAELKQEAGSNVIPLGKVRTGTYYHRALLFKVAADHVRLPSVLVRSEYGRAYNVVYAPNALVVDVMHEPGRLCPIQDLEQLAIPGNFFEFHR